VKPTRGWLWYHRVIAAGSGAVAAGGIFIGLTGEYQTELWSWDRVGLWATICAYATVTAIRDKAEIDRDP